jgi:RsmE family RNA methyltransferase
MTHIHTVLRAQLGDRLVVGMRGGNMGHGVVTALREGVVELEITVETPPPPRAPVLLVLALPRPKVLRRVLQHVAAFGLEDVVLLQTWRVEKSFWSSPLLGAKEVDAALRLGLEQAQDTRAPKVHTARRFKPFVEDTLPGMLVDRRGLLAHPHAPPCPRNVSGALALAVGPEGGWTEYERGMLRDAGFAPVSLGRRILRTESAISALLGRLL